MTEPEKPLTLDEARARLRARGYLDRGVEGAVLKGALAARSREKAAIRAVSVAALLLALTLAAAETAFVAVASALAARDAVVLFVYLVAGAAAVAFLLVLLLAGAARWRLRRATDADAAAAELGLFFGVVAGSLAALAAVSALGSAGPLAVAGVLLAVAVVVFVAVRVARGLATALVVASGDFPLTRPRRAGVVLLSAVVVALTLVVLFASGRRPPREEPLVVEANDHRVVVVAVDGWSDAYAGRVDLPASRLAYGKRESDPAAFWTTVATGEPPKIHGIGSLDLVRLRGLRSPVKPVAGTGPYLTRLLPALHLSRRESVTAAARRVPAAWEVARRAGVASLVVNWWTTYPAADDGGTILSNHLFFAARAGRPLAGEGWPPEALERAARLAPRVVPEPGTLDRLIEDATGADEFAWRAFRDAFAREKPRLAMVYLPGLDILASALGAPERSASDRVALANALGEEARRVRGWLSAPEVAGAADLMVTLLDGGRAEARGEALLSGRLVRTQAEAAPRTLDMVDVAPTVLAALGIPASREIAGKPRLDLLARGGATTSNVASWGRRRAGAAPPVDPKEYVENLRSLGYLK